MTTLSGILTGLAGGAVGTLAMGQYWTKIAPLVQPQSPPPEPGPDRHSIAPLGQLHRPGESSTAALGRLGYEALKGKPPRSDRLKSELSEGVHWSMGVMSGALFDQFSAPHCMPLGEHAFPMMSDELAVV